MVLYVIRNTTNGKEYVGTTTQSLPLRLGGHRRQVKRVVTHPLYDAIRAQGWSVFETTVIAETTDYEELLRLEQYAIGERRTLNPDGYNLVKGGRGNRGWIMKQETKDKIAAKAIGRAAWNRGVPMTDAVRAKLSAVRKGQNTPAQAAVRARLAVDPVHCQKISSGRRRAWAALSPEQRKVMNANAAAKLAVSWAWSEERKARAAEARRQWWASKTPEQRTAHAALISAGHRRVA